MVSRAADNARTTFESGVCSKAPVAERQELLYRAAAVIRDLHEIRFGRGRVSNGKRDPLRIGGLSVDP